VQQTWGNFLCFKYKLAYAKTEIIRDKWRDGKIMQLNSNYNNNAERMFNLLVSEGVQVVLKKCFHKVELLFYGNTSNEKSYT
jgi:hypothetical protein